MLLQRPAQPSKHSRLAIFVAFHNFHFHNLAVLHKKMWFDLSILVAAFPCF